MAAAQSNPPSVPQDNTHHNLDFRQASGNVIVTDNSAPASEDIKDRTPDSSSNPFPFRKFPAEIRNMIWLFTTEGEPSRLIEVRGPRLTSRFPEQLDDELHLLKKVKNHDYVSTMPAVLHATSESRAVAKKVYELLGSATSGKPAYINYDKDILFFARSDLRFTELFVRQMIDKEKVRRLADWTGHLETDWFPGEDNVPPYFAQFPNLREVIYINALDHADKDSYRYCDCAKGSQNSTTHLISEDALKYYQRSHKQFYSDTYQDCSKSMLMTEAINTEQMIDAVEKGIISRWSIPSFTGMWAWFGNIPKGRFYFSALE